MIEIEKKFVLTQKQEERLLEGATHIETKQVHDNYYDTASFMLSTQDYWLRERNGLFELKVPLSSERQGRTSTNRYRELTDATEIAKELQLDAPVDLLAALKQAGITPFVSIHTQRNSYAKQGFHLDIDTATYDNSDFTYAVSEIELLVQSEHEAEEAEANILQFATDTGLTTDQVILGKVFAFLRSERPEHYGALVASSVI